MLTRYDRPVSVYAFFFFNDTATTEIYTLSLHDALPRPPGRARPQAARRGRRGTEHRRHGRLLPGEHRHRRAARAGAPRGVRAGAARARGPGRALPGRAVRGADAHGRRYAIRARVQL